MRLLLVRLSAMGDVIHALPLAGSAAASGATVGWVVERAFAGLLEGNPNCARVFVADTKAWRRRPFARDTRAGVRALRRELRAFAPDRTIDVQGLWKSAWIARMAGAPVAGFAAGERREGSSALLCNVPVTPAPEARHVVDRNLALLAAAGIPIAARAPDAAYLLARPSPEADAFLASVPRPFAVFHPGAGREDKTWPEERFATLARALQGAGRPAPRRLVGTGRRAARRPTRRPAARRFTPAAARLSGPRATGRRGAPLRRRRHRPAASRRRPRHADAGALRADGSGAQRAVPGSAGRRRGHGRGRGRRGPEASARAVALTVRRPPPL